MAASNPTIQEGDSHSLAPSDLELMPPEPVQSTVLLIVHTHDTQRLIRGRPAGDSKAAIIGLFGFAERLRQVWDAARLADPYAVWWLIKVEDAHAAAQAKIELERASVQQALDAVAEFEIDIATNESPCRVDLNFACPYAYWAARLLKTYDELALAATMAERLGIRSRKSSARNRFRCERAIRALFASPQGYRAIGLSRKDVNESTEAAQQARELMGDLPHAVLAGDRVPTLLPTTTTAVHRAVVTEQ